MVDSFLPVCNQLCQVSEIRGQSVVFNRETLRSLESRQANFTSKINKFMKGIIQVRLNTLSPVVLREGAGFKI